MQHDFFLWLSLCEVADDFRYSWVGLSTEGTNIGGVLCDKD
jgi:hypothetical protein